MDAVIAKTAKRQALMKRKAAPSGMAVTIVMPPPGGGKPRDRAEPAAAPSTVESRLAALEQWRATCEQESDT